MGLYSYQKKGRIMTETVIVKDWEKPCSARIDNMWYARKIDLTDPEFEGLGFDYVEPHTFHDLSLIHI